MRNSSKKKFREEEKLERDVTRDSVIITRDLHVIRNHTNHKSQGHKIGVKTTIRTKIQSNELSLEEGISRLKGKKLHNLLNLYIPKQAGADKQFSS